MKRLIISLLLFQSVSTYGQQDCTLTLEQAKIDFNQGKFYDITYLLEPCFKSNGFNKSQKIEAFLLLTRTYLLLDQAAKAEENYLNLLKLDPEYKLDADNDPIDLVYLSKKFITTPIFVFFTRLGASYSTASKIQNYGVDNTNNSKESYQPGFGFAFGTGIEWNWSKHLSIGAELNYQDRRYEYNNILFGGDEQSVIEIQSSLGVPIFFKYRSQFNNIYPFIYLGIAHNYLINVQLELELEDEIGFGENQRNYTVSGRREDLVALRNRLNRSFLIGIGSSIRIGNNYLSLDLRYYYGLTNFVKEGTQYANSNLIYKYGYIDDYKRLQSLMLTVGWVVPLYKPRKITNEKKSFLNIFSR